MEYRNFGQTDLKPSAIGFGCAGIASVSTLNPQKEIVATLHEALDRGINFFDTADIYGQGDSERLLGSVFRGQRHRVLLCSKVGYIFGAGQYVARRLKPLAQTLVRRWKSGRAAAIAIRSRSQRQNFSPEHIRIAVEGSLRRLGTEYLDVLLLHSPPADVIVDGTALETLVRLKDRGLVRYYGVSCACSSDAIACLRYSGLSVLQIRVNLLETETIDTVIPRANEQKVAIVARTPFAQGSLITDRYLLWLAKKTPGRSAAQMALQFVMQLSGVSVVLPGMTSRAHLRENIAALSAPHC